MLKLMTADVIFHHQLTRTCRAESYLTACSVLFSWTGRWKSEEKDKLMQFSYLKCIHLTNGTRSSKQQSVAMEAKLFGMNREDVSSLSWVQPTYSSAAHLTNASSLLMWLHL